MRKTKIIITLLCFWFGLMPLAAQSLTITKDFAQVPMASVLAMYKNQFGKWEKPDLDITFPYAVVRMHLEGSGREVTMAKQTLTLYMGPQTAVLDRYTENSNEILFLIPARRPTVYVDCGDGCDRVLLVGNQQLQPNSVYDCTVRFVPEEEYVAPTTTQAPKRQFFKFRVTPADAIVEVDVDGQKDMWHVSDGVASKPLNYGSYRYTISANRYHTESGEFVVSDTETEKTVSLRPKFGYLYITSNVAQGAYVYATNLLTGARQSLGTVPVNGKDLDSGTYSILIQKDKYKDYTATITIDDEQTTTLNPTLEANFVQLTLTTSAQSDMYIDGQKLGTGRWTGTLELGEYSVETRQASHQSAYTTLRVTPQSAGQTIALNNPIPIYGSMVLTSSPADAVVYIDDKKVGTSPVIVNELLVGTHTIRLEKDGYDQQETMVLIAENQESMLEFTLSKSVENNPITIASLSKTIPPTISINNLVITHPFTQVPYASVLTMYKNEFSKYQMNDMDLTFPYALVRMHLEGDEQAISVAKRTLNLYMGLHMAVHERVATYSNQILFLVPAPRHPMIFIECGDGCEQVLLSDKQQLQPNCLYDCTIKLVSENKDIILNSNATYKVNSHEYVDLGLSVKWATCNVGANKPEEYGDYFAWGETTQKSIYNDSTYKYHNGSSGVLTKYNDGSCSWAGTIDNKKTLELSDDAARVNLGERWHIPTDAEWNELCKKCKWKKTSLNGVKGYEVCGRNGNSIFLPAAGKVLHDNVYKGYVDQGTDGAYWMNSLYMECSSFANILAFSTTEGGSSIPYINAWKRGGGCSIRPVCP